MIATPSEPCRSLFLILHPRCSAHPLESQSIRARSFAPTARTRAHTDDGVEDESHWQDRVSSGFDRLVAFASTELDKTRRSIEDVAGPQPSRSASPDSGITHNVLSSTSSTSSTSQSEASLVPKGVVTLPLARTSPGEAASEKSSPPQTPSPAESPHIIPAMRAGSPTLKIPLKYQRQSKVKHYKKKFRDRKWDYDDYAEPETFAGGGDGGGVASSAQPATTTPSAEELGGGGEHGGGNVVNVMKTSKFRPKGKDWGRANHEEGTD